MAALWFIENIDGTVDGPFHERQISSDLISGKIDLKLRVRQGNGPWCDANRAREMFHQLAEQGWYIRSDKETFGPFTSERLLELYRANEISPGAEVRQGTTSPWKPSSSVLSLWQTRRAEVAGSTSRPDRRSKWSTEPIRHYSLSLELAFQDVVDTCLANERLWIREPEPSHGNDRFAVARSNDQTVGFLSQANTLQLTANSQRGITHIVLFDRRPSPSRPQIVLVLCPPGAKGEECREYIEASFPRAISAV